jgi:hypothetical protein
MPWKNLQNLTHTTAFTGLPTMEERTAVGNGEKAIVLLRMHCTIEKPYHGDVFKLWSGNNIDFYLGSFKTGGEPEPLTRLRFLSSGSRTNGWTYFVLPHGIYYLAVSSYEHSVEATPHWRIDIPQDARLVYAGTLRFTGVSEGLPFGLRTIRSIQFDEMRVTNEEELARKLLTEAFPGFGEAQTCLMRLQQGTIILRSPLPSSTK